MSISHLHTHEYTGVHAPMRTHTYKNTYIILKVNYTVPLNQIM